MAQLIVRGIEGSVVKSLRARAAENQVSAEEEHRRILREALLAPIGRRSLKALLRAIPQASTDEGPDVFTPPRDRPRRVRFAP